MNAKPPLPSNTLGHARSMRTQQTDAESRLWQHLRAGRFNGLKFRRQHPVPPYIADFCCVEKKLVIELDGSQHAPEVDASRTCYLQLHGWRVLRFWDNEVLNRTEAVIEAIWNVVSETDPLPSLSPGERGSRTLRTSMAPTLSPASLPEGERLKNVKVIDSPTLSPTPLPEGEGLKRQEP